MAQYFPLPDFLLRTRSVAILCGTALILPALGGCRLVDQRSFDPDAGRPPKPYIPPAPPAPAPRPAFLRIEAGTPPSEYGPVVTHAVRAALARKPNVLFIVQGITPMQSDPAAQAQALTTLTQQDVAPIAARIAAAGAQPIQIEIHARTDPTASHAYIRVDVR